MVGHVFVVPVALQPVLRSVLLDEVTDAVAEVVGLEEEKLDDEVADLGLVPLVTPHCLRSRKHQERKNNEPQVPEGTTTRYSTDTPVSQIIKTTSV